MRRGSTYAYINRMGNPQDVLGASVYYDAHLELQRVYNYYSRLAPSTPLNLYTSIWFCYICKNKPLLTELGLLHLQVLSGETSLI